MGNLANKMKEDAKSDLARTSSGWFKFKEGVNKLRILTEPIAIYEDFRLGMCYTDCKFQGSIKYMAYVLDLDKNEIVKMKIPYGIFQTMAKWEDDEDYQFTAFPMPYDMWVDAENAGTKEVKYATTPRPKRYEISEEISAMLKKQKPIAEIIEGMKEANKQKHMADGTYERLHSEGGAQKETRGTDRSQIDYPKDEINPDDIPF